MNFWPFSKKPKMASPAKFELPPGVVLIAPPNAPESRSENPEKVVASLSNGEPLTHSTPIEETLPPAEEAIPYETDASWAAELLQNGSSTISSPHSVEEPASANNPPSIPMLRDLTETAAVSPAEISQATAVPHDSSIHAGPSMAQTVDYLFEKTHASSHDFWKQPPTPAASIESGLFSALEPVMPVLSEAIEPIAQPSVSPEACIQDEDLPELPDFSDMTTLEVLPDIPETTDSLDPVESDFAEMARYLPDELSETALESTFGNAETPELSSSTETSLFWEFGEDIPSAENTEHQTDSFTADDEAVKTTDWELEASLWGIPEPDKDTLIENNLNENTPEETLSGENSFQAEIRLTDENASFETRDDASDVFSAPSPESESGTETETSEETNQAGEWLLDMEPDDIKQPEEASQKPIDAPPMLPQTHYFEAPIGTKPESVSIAASHTAPIKPNYGPLPFYDESMADQLDQFGRKILLQDTHFMKQSIDRLVESYFARQQSDPI